MPLSNLLPASARTLALGALALLCSTAGAAPADLFRQWAADPWIERQVSLADLGFDKPIALRGGGGDNDIRRELFLPVPAGIPLQGATLQLDADYLRGDGGRSTFVLSLDGYPVSSRRFSDDKGDASLNIGVDGARRDTGFVRVGALWNSVVSDVVCADQSAPGNVLRVLPTTRLRYRIDRSQLGSLATAWSTLPPAPVLLVASRSVGQPAYDAAWRIGVALERAGKRVQVRALPAVGDTIDMGNAPLPADLRSVPAFAALAAEGGRHRIGSAAEVGALLTLGSHGPLQADIAIADSALAQQVNAALDALGAQMGGVDAEAFAAWRASAFGLAAQPPKAGEVALKSFGGAPVVAVAADAGPKAALLFDSLWKPVAGGSTIALATVSRPRPDERILLSDLGGKPGSLDVGNRSDWTATFGIEDVTDDGRGPRALVFDLSATPDSTGAGPVASVYYNDFLLGAELLPPDGKPHRMRVRVPDYMLAARNVVRVSFLRQLSKPRCHDQQTSYPVSVLPTSHVELGKIASGSTFTGVRRLFADGGQVIVPAAWLADAPTSLPRAIRYADTAGVSLARTTLVVVADDKARDPVRPTATFLALGLPVENAPARLDPQQGRLVLANGKTTLLDASHLDRTAVLQVADSGGQRGIVFEATAPDAPVPRKPLQLSHGDVALLDANGVTLEIDSRDPHGAQLADQANPESLWQRYRGWWIALGVVVVLLLLVARIAQVRRRQWLRVHGAMPGNTP